MKKCADFQADGGNCVLMLPADSLLDCNLYEDHVKHTTIRVDLPLFPFKEFKDPLFRHIVLLYFM